MGFKSGFVSIIGRPNSGKSTLLNYFVGSKVAIISDKPQTTRNKVQGVCTLENAQLIFIDTPGVHKPKNKLGEFMVNTATRALHEVDVILHIIDASVQIGPGEQYIMNILKYIDTEVFLVINKIDLVNRGVVAEKIQSMSSKFNFTEVVPVSAVTGENMQTLLNVLISYLPEGPQYFPGDMITDRPEQFIISEFIREQVFANTEEEIPYTTAVQIEEIEEKNGMFYVRATIYTERSSQKGIIIGKNGQKLKKIGAAARQEIENLLGSRVYLDLWVKMRKDWRRQDLSLRQFGYGSED